MTPPPSHCYVHGANACNNTCCQIWDTRTGSSVLTFRGHSGDVNSVTFFPDGNAIGTGSDDTSCRLFDMRCASELGVFGTPQILSGITSGESLGVCV
jgi:guanine nucleotide-binding protein G(I)/G(S)/G(T) subunit beta-1